MGLFGPPNIEKMKARRDVNGLIKALSYQKDSLIRGDAVDALGALKDAQAVEPLYTVIREQTEDEYVRERAAMALGRIGDRRAIDPLVAALSEKKISQGGVDVLDKLGWKPGNDKASINYHIIKHNWAELIAMGAPAYEPLIAALIDTLNPYQNMWQLTKDLSVYKYLGDLHDARAVEPLIAIIKTSTPPICKFNAYIALGEIGVHLEDSALRSHAVETLIADFQTCEPSTREVISTALVKIGDKRAIPLFADRLEFPYANDALVKFGAAAIDILLSKLKEGKDKRGQAVVVLEKIGWKPTQDEYGAHYWIAKKEWGKCLAIGAAAIEPLARSLKEIKSGDEATYRKTVEMLIQLYKDSQIAEVKKLLLDHRAEIKIDHGDYGNFETCGTFFPHQDIPGLDFPL